MPNRARTSERPSTAQQPKRAAGATVERPCAHFASPGGVVIAPALTERRRAVDGMAKDARPFFVVAREGMAARRAAIAGLADRGARQPS